jgi:hypothetical protein
MSSEHQCESLFQMSIKVAHLPSDIVNADSIHQAQGRAIELSENAGNRPGTGLTGIFP